MRKVINTINFYQMKIEDEESLIKAVDKIYKEEGDEAAHRYVEAEKQKLIEVKMGYLGIVKAWIDTLPSEDEKMLYSLTEKEINQQLIKYYEQVGKNVIVDFVMGYNDIVDLVLEKYSPYDISCTQPETLYQSVLKMIESKNPDTEIINVFKYIRIKDEDVYNKLVLRRRLPKEMRKVDLSHINSEF